VGKPSATGQPTRPTQPLILLGSINEYRSNNNNNNIPISRAP